MTLDPPSPARRVILLGASNLTQSFPLIVETVRQRWPEPVEFMVAMGLGRSYGEDSTVLGRKISGIFPCRLWDDLRRRPPLPTAALITDIGNDLLYGVPVAKVAEWVDRCLERLEEAGATTIVTQLPLGNLEGLGETRFRLFRTLLFPANRRSLRDVASSAHELGDALTALGGRRKIRLIPVQYEWYGFDPIHLKRSVRRRAWSEILSAWEPHRVLQDVPRRSWWRGAYLRCLPPAERTIWGVRRVCAQPSGVLTDGSTVSLY